MTNQQFIGADQKLSLASLRRTGMIQNPPRIMIYGPQKIGKSTFGAMAPSPIFVQIEDGLDGLRAPDGTPLRVPAFPQSRTFNDVIAAMNVLYSEAHDFKTLVVDSLDWLENLIWKHTCQSVSPAKESIEDFGYGKGYVAALDHWRTFLGWMNSLRDTKGMAIILLAHAEIKRFDAPDKAASYDRYQPKLHKSAGALVQEAVDVIGFANLDATIVQTDVGFNQKKAKAVGDGFRTLYLQERPSCLAGSRYRMPPQIPFEWNAFSQSFAAATAAPTPAPVAAA